MWNNSIFKSTEVNSWADTWSYCTDLLADSQHIQAQLFQKVTLTFPASHQTLVKSLCSGMVEPRAHRACVTVWMSETKQRGKTRKKIQDDCCFPSICYHGRASDALDSWSSPQTTTMTQIWGSAWSRVATSASWPEIEPHFSNRTHKDIKKRFTRKYVLMVLK